ncbi:MAG: GFA family protein [Planctomycetota bacterium]|jgi:hypothetical protein
MIKGSCLCRQVTFAVNGPISELSSCHCTECRKAYGSAFGTVAICKRGNFKYLSGQNRISSYKQTERVTRYFCNNCGSPLPIIEDWDPLVGIPAGLLDDDPKAKIKEQIFVKHKAPWWEITDNIPQYDEWSTHSCPENRKDVTPPRTSTA